QGSPQASSRAADAPEPDEPRSRCPASAARTMFCRPYRLSLLRPILNIGPRRDAALSSRRRSRARVNTVPVIALTGYLGAGQTGLLNHVRRRRRATLGVVGHAFGDVGVDAGLLVGQVTDPAAISGGCLCCLDDAGGLDAALERLAAPRLRLDAIIVEASATPSQPGAPGTAPS